MKEENQKVTINALSKSSPRTVSFCFPFITFLRLALGIGIPLPSGIVMTPVAPIMIFGFSMTLEVLRNLVVDQVLSKSPCQDVLR